MMPKVELVYFCGCPHVEAARAAVRAALVTLGFAPTWEEWDQDAPATPESLRRYGCPTVLIDGRDVRAGPGQCVGRACRVDGVPSIEEIRLALVQRMTA